MNWLIVIALGIVLFGGIFLIVSRFRKMIKEQQDDLVELFELKNRMTR